MSTITLRYLINPGNRPIAAATQSKIGNIRVAFGELDMLGMTIVSDTVQLNGSKYERTIELHHDDTTFPTDAEKVALTRNLYSAALSMGFPGAVQSLEPTVTP